MIFARGALHLYLKKQMTLLVIIFNIHAILFPNYFLRPLPPTLNIKSS